MPVSERHNHSKKFKVGKCKAIGLKKEKEEKSTTTTAMTDSDCQSQTKF